MRILAAAAILLLAASRPLDGTFIASKAVETMRVVDLNGSTWTADALRGRVTLIDFWATWCAPCLTELPVLKEARRRYSRDEFEVLGISFDVSDRRTLISWMNRQGVTWPQVFDGRGRTGPVPRHFAVAAVPTSFLVDADARVVAMNLRGARLLAAIEREVDALRDGIPRKAAHPTSD